jgi:hypothetical protein
MLLYYGLATLFFLQAVYCSTKEIKTNIGIASIGKFNVFLLILITIILGGIRWETGTDWVNYYNFFHYNASTWKDYHKNFEISYNLLNFIINKYFNSYTLLLIIMSFFVIVLRYNTIKLISVYPIMSYYLFFCDNIGGMFAVRQTLAISIVLTSIYYIHKKNKILFILITILAISFHLSMIIWFISYPLYHKKINSKTMILLFIIATGIGMLGTKLLIFLVEGTIVKFSISGHIASRIQTYILGKYNDGSFSVFRMILSFVKRVIFVVLFLILRPRIIQKSVYANGLLNIYLVSNVIYSLFAFNEAFAPMARVVTVFLFIETLLLPLILNLCKYNYTKYIIFLLFYLYGLMKLNSNLSAYFDLYIPYRSIFN